MSEQKSLEQIIMEAIDFCTHTRCKKCEYYGKDSTYEHNGNCRGRMMADHLRKNGVVVREKGEWQYTEDIDEDGNIQAYCSACGAGDKHATSMVGKVPYCWKCGADMRKGENDGV